jgi:crotonobetainyl-CoA:carnitine CoA-transferase CaiB-like acyl-CoA transferase
MTELDAARLPASPLYSPQQVLDDPHVQAMGFLQAVDYPGLPEGAPLIETPFRLSSTPGTIRSRPPQLGEHTDEVLRAAGYSAEAIGALRADGII